MSTGQARWSDEMATEKRKSLESRLEELGIDRIACIIENLEDALLSFEQDLPTMSRIGWQRLDRIKKLVTQLTKLESN